MSAGQAIAVAVGFVAAVFALGMGAGMFADWLRAKDQERRRNAGVTAVPPSPLMDPQRVRELAAADIEAAFQRGKRAGYSEGFLAAKDGVAPIEGAQR